MTSNSRSLDQILQSAATVAEGLNALRSKSNCVVAFIDLVGSTQYKQQHQSEEDWLPWLAAFLTGVTEIIAGHGRVVKYIGDEVMAVFEGPDAVLHARHAAEQILSFCLQSGNLGFAAKIAVDYGAVSFLDFREFGAPSATILGDPHGGVVDRCARIIRHALPNTVLASASFVEFSPSRKTWRSLGALNAKGFTKKVRVYQLCFAEDVTPIVTLGPETSLSDCQQQLQEALKMLEDVKKLRE